MIKSIKGRQGGELHGEIIGKMTGGTKKKAIDLMVGFKCSRERRSTKQVRRNGSQIGKGGGKG